MYAMKKIFLLSLLGLIGASCAQTPIEETTLTVYTYDSLAADYGLLPAITDQFETEQGITLKVVTFADTGAMINQLIAEKNDPQADIVMGIDNLDVARFGDDNLFANPTAFDYGYVGFVYDTTQLTFTEPISLEALAEDEAYQDKIIIEQAGLSSPGTQLLAWGQAVFGDDANEFWEALAEQTLTVAPDWSTAYYTMFLNGEAPIVLSYLTSPAYHIDQEGSYQYAAIPMEDGYLKQTEYVAQVSGSTNTSSGQAFIDYVLSDSVQNQIPATQWMFPVGGDSATWPAAYGDIITPTETEVVTLTDEEIKENFTAWLQDWNQAFGIQ